MPDNKVLNMLLDRLQLVEYKGNCLIHLGSGDYMDYDHFERMDKPDMFLLMVNQWYIGAFRDIVYSHQDNIIEISGVCSYITDHCINDIILGGVRFKGIARCRPSRTVLSGFNRFRLDVYNGVTMSDTIYGHVRRR